MTKSSCTLALGAVSLGAIAALVVVLVPSAASADLAGFAGSASARGVHVSVAVHPANLVEEPADSSAPRADVALDSRGNSTASASLPHPGDAVLSTPSLLSLLGVLPPRAPPVPGYPLLASSEADSRPESTVDAGPYALTASSGPRRGAASAVLRGGTQPEATVATSSSTAWVEVEEDTVSSVAETVTDGARFGPLVLGHVRTYASAIRRGGEVAMVEGGFELEGATVGDVPIDIDSEAITLSGQRIPLGEAATDPTLGALGLAGLRVELLPSTATEDGIEVGGLRLTRELTIGEGLPVIEGVPGSGVIGTRVTVTMLLGSASASAAAVPPAPVASGTASAPSMPGADPPSSASAETVGATTGSAASAAPIRPSAETAHAEAASFATFTTASFYLALVAAGLVMSGGAHLARRAS